MSTQKQPAHKVAESHVLQPCTLFCHSTSADYEVGDLILGIKDEPVLVAGILELLVQEKGDKAVQFFQSVLNEMDEGAVDVILEAAL